MIVRSERVICPLTRNQYVYPDSYRGYGNRPAPTRVGGTTGFIEDWWRTEDYERRRRRIAHPPKKPFYLKFLNDVLVREA